MRIIYNTDNNDRSIDKVTCFITREGAQGTDLLLFEHPHAGIQIPAGTVEPGETPEEAAVREAVEETGLVNLAITQHVGVKEEKLQEDQWLEYLFRAEI